MRTVSARQQAITIGIISASLAMGSVATVILIDEPNIYITLVFIGLLVFLVVFLVVFYFLNSFIFKKLKPIYKTINTINFSEQQLRSDLEEKDRDMIQEVQNDVLKWAKRKTSEISQLKQLEKHRREFLGNVSHELKTPIFNIQGYISTLIDGGIHDETVNVRYLERAEKSVNRLISIVNDLESISRLESGESKLEIQSFNIIKLIEEVFEEHEMAASERNIKLKFAFNPDKPILVKADNKRILEVFNNLIINSIKYGKEGGKTIVDFLDMEDQILIEVSDNGIGIAEKDLPRIFERFYRTDKGRSREMGGTGLGLSIVKHILEAHNQTINVRSEISRGSAFNFTLQKA